MERMKLYPCEYPNCDAKQAIRTTIKDPNSDYYGKKVCNYHANILRPKKLVKKKAVEGRSDFFKKHIEIIQKNQLCCEECGRRLLGIAAEVAHIISKSKHPEIAHEDSNILYLCVEHHGKFDRSNADRKEMKCFEKSKERYLELKDKLESVTNEIIFYNNEIFK